jgi:hypothetical protein
VLHICTRQKLLLAVALDGIQPLWLDCWLLGKAKALRSPTKGTLSALGTHKDYNRLMVISCKKFKRMVVDIHMFTISIADFVYALWH